MFRILFPLLTLLIEPDMTVVGFVSWLDITAFLVKVATEPKASEEVPWSASLENDDTGSSFLLSYSISFLSIGFHRL